MSLVRAGGITTVLLAILLTATLIGFAGTRSNFDTADIVERIFYFFPVSLLGLVPVTLVIFPIMHLLLSQRGPVRPSLFALVGGIFGAAVTGYILIRFRGALFQPISIAFIAIPLLTVIGTVSGGLAGYVFEWLARKKAPASDAEV